MTGLWIWFKASSRTWEQAPRFFNDITEERLIALRAKVKAAFKEWLAKNGGTTFGFVPRTFAASIAVEAGVRVTGFDGIMLVYALYMSIKVAPGTWGTGPEHPWKHLPSFVKDTWGSR